MVDMDTFLTTPYVMMDDFCQSQLGLTCLHGPIRVKRCLQQRSQLLT